MEGNEKQAFYLRNKSYLSIDEAIRNAKILIEKYSDVTIDGIEVDATLKALIDFADGKLV